MSVLNPNFTEEQSHNGIIFADQHPPHENEIVRRLHLISNKVTEDRVEDQSRYI
jgi:hypothetical protein